MYGKTVLTPRLLSCMRDDDLDLSKSYKVTPSYPWMNCVLDLKHRVECFLATSFNYAQLNYYRNGSDYIGYHSDSEVRDGDVVASISLGGIRRFQTRHKEYDKYPDMPVINLDMGHGSLLIMGGDYQNYWKHGVPKQNGALPRINITFRVAK
eukprot:NODE_9786_length_565_cov_19.409502_g9148_i0.p1 GENE.NODE_9786_length_565_cov_19.409502_g9148_i0~~NODE_9786_length_565_cov_19.409502_g9148_i0.p1  ORF type:complete len:168 (+),score=36.63 NODE_9786_length_565_cov_19.409502_g9148_i0:49-504(+)